MRKAVYLLRKLCGRGVRWLDKLYKVLLLPAAGGAKRQMGRLVRALRSLRNETARRYAGRIRHNLTMGFGSFAELFSQRHCLACEAPLGGTSRLLCWSCAREVLRGRISVELSPSAFTSLLQEQRIKGLAGIWAVSTYDTLVRDMVLQFKFHGRFAVLPVLLSMFERRFRELQCELRSEVVVPVPGSRLRYLYRGTDLPACLAVSLRDRFRIRAVKALGRKRLSGRQVRKSKNARLKLDCGTFRITRPAAVRDRRVLLVDDVLTTGATVRACSQVLLAGGAREVGILVLAQG